jgi:hypothetical protein
MAHRMRADAGTIVHDNYICTASYVEKTFANKANFILIQNTDATNTVNVSFDAGVTDFQIVAGASLSLDVDNLQSIHLKGSASGEVLHILVGSEA